MATRGQRKPVDPVKAAANEARRQEREAKRQEREAKREAAWARQRAEDRVKALKKLPKLLDLFDWRRKGYARDEQKYRIHLRLLKEYEAASEREQGRDADAFRRLAAEYRSELEEVEREHAWCLGYHMRYEHEIAAAMDDAGLDVVEADGCLIFRVDETRPASGGRPRPGLYKLAVVPLGDDPTAPVEVVPTRAEREQDRDDDADACARS